MIAQSIKILFLRDLAARFVQSNRGTWIALAIGILAVLSLLVWIFFSLFGWLWEQGNSLAKEAPEAARIVAAQVEQVAPGVHAALGDLVPALKPEPPPRDVSGSDIGPVARFPGLPRSHWHRDGREVTVRYEGRADYAAVLDHYARGFTAQGFAQRVISAVPEAEVHEYRKGTDKVMFRISQLPQDKVKATIIAELP